MGSIRNKQDVLNSTSNVNHSSLLPILKQDVYDLNSTLNSQVENTDMKNKSNRPDFLVSKQKNLWGNITVSEMALGSQKEEFGISGYKVNPNLRFNFHPKPKMSNTKKLSYIDEI